MSSFVRKIQLRLQREMGLIPPRHKATLKFKGQPYRNGEFKVIDGKEVFVRYH